MLCSGKIPNKSFKGELSVWAGAMQLAINSNCYDIIATTSEGNMPREPPRNTGLAYYHIIFDKQSWTQLAPLIKEVKLNNLFLKSISVTYSLSLQIMGLVGLLNTLA
jgi:hypothetical protein